MSRESFRSFLPFRLLLISTLCVGALSLYDTSDSVEQLTGDNFDEEVLQSEDFWIVEFYAPWCGHCQKLAPEWKKAAKELLGVARVGAVNCDEDSNKGLASKYGIKGFPTIKVFGEDKTKPSDYQQAREAGAIVEFVKEAAGPGAASSKLVTPLTYLDTYFFLHGDSAPKAILLTEGERKPPSWLASLAVKYKDGKERSVRFAHADVGAHPQIAKNFRLDRFPALVIARITGTFKEAEGFFSAFTKLGGKGSDNIRAAKEAVDEIALGDFDERSLAPLPAFPPPETPRRTAPTSFFRLDHDNADTVCFGGEKPICVLAIVAGASGDDFPGKEELVALSRKYRNDPFSFVWLDGSAQTEFVSGFGLGADRLPAVVVVKHGRRTRFALHEGAFTAAAVSELLDRTLGGDVAFKSLKPVPELVPPYLQDQEDVADE
uniref:Protein disulfide-isomerase A6 n=1 Tax=Tetraselmis sp. GSL018 TaxID=582737 RepID=A0A061R584_9CHLO|mmetsp:Transcript_30067/g.71646  ORF Transcript_30067/g.71646 Transcript_30067/m.71646 type:complete len:433 (+) Transcript_30067:161-1459(+)